MIKESLVKHLRNRLHCEIDEYGTRINQLERRRDGPDMIYRFDNTYIHICTDIMLSIPITTIVSSYLEDQRNLKIYTIRI